MRSLNRVPNSLQRLSRHSGSSNCAFSRPQWQSSSPPHRTFTTQSARSPPQAIPRSSSNGQIIRSSSISRYSLRVPLKRCGQKPSAVAVRSFSTTPSQQHGHLEKPKPGEERTVTFIDKNGTEHTFDDIADGANLLDVAQAHDLEMEGACGGSCACSTCHVIVEDPDVFDKIPEASDDENDMLDLAFGLTETSRLGCQVEMSKELSGLVVRLPNATRNLQKSDFES